MGFLEGLYNVAKGVVHFLAEQQTQYDAAQAKFERQGVEDWDEDEINRRIKYASNFQEEVVLREKLREKNNK